MLKEYTCIVCPNGCKIQAEIKDGCIETIEGAMCSKGKSYVSQEILEPKRTIATSITVIGGEVPLSSVRTTKPIPKDMIFDVMKEIKKVSVEAPVKAGQVVISDVLGTGSNVIVTRDVQAFYGENA